MSFEAERKAIERHFQDGWARYFADPTIWAGFTNSEGAAAVPNPDLGPFRVAFDNVAFRPPKPDLENPQNTTWVRLTILPAGASQITVGSSPILQHNGVISVQIFHPINSRANVLHRFADIASKVFDLVSIPLSDIPGSVVQCLRSTLVRVGPFNEWYQANVNTVYLRQGQSGVSTAADRLIDYGVLKDRDDEGTWIAANNSPVTFSGALTTRVVFPATTEDSRRFWFEPRSPHRFAFAAVYNTAFDTAGTRDDQWRGHHPLLPMMHERADYGRVVYVSEPYTPGVRYVANIHHLFEVA